MTDNNAYVCSFYCNGATDQNNVVHSTPWSTYVAALSAAQAYTNVVNAWWASAHSGESWTDPTPMEDTAHPNTRYGVLIGLKSETYENTGPEGHCPTAPSGTVLEVTEGAVGDWENLPT